MQVQVADPGHVLHVGWAGGLVESLPAGSIGAGRLCSALQGTLHHVKQE